MIVLRDVEVDGRRVNVQVRGDRVVALGPVRTVPRSRGVTVLEGSGGALLPGLHDHHLHLLAAAAAHSSVGCGPNAVADAEELGAALRAAGPPGTWVRGVGYHESVAGPLDRDLLDRICPDRLVRVQHRGGALWILNSAALAATGVANDADPDVSRDEHGRADGRLWRYDSRLRKRLPDAAWPDLAFLGRSLASYGITGITDATPDLSDSAVAYLRGTVTARVLPAHLTVLGSLGPPPPLRSGPVKLHLRDHDLPSADALSELVRAARSANRGVAVHCVGAESLALTLATLAKLGSHPQDRIEHASVVPPSMRSDLRTLGVAVVTQPGFVYARGDEYLQEIAEPELSWLYPFASLLAEGIPVVASSDHPYGPLDPWTVIRAATTRTTSGGTRLSPDERVPAALALRGYLTASHDPGGAVRTVTPGASADLCLLDAPLATVLADPQAGRVVATMVQGQFTHRR
ncbi:amidohydrolase family protein [Nocardioides massiliensis]|uniref:Amidohydrolase YtcJ n=1 Tax=Nocardioides massiliensis TaxID=1325935 RepID=A0ABT9NKL8_9ACTN|nr:amidohydrolase family protein [Nocardioides massiliensis]MDP9820757.1 putative amidohydrolase YtcJ [Nocardioides massiliensis]